MDLKIDQTIFMLNSMMRLLDGNDIHTLSTREEGEAQRKSAAGSVADSDVEYLP